MGLLPCPFPCTTEKESQSHSNSLRLSESSASASSLSSQISLPSVPSLIPPSSQQHDHQISVVYHQCLATLGGHSSYVFSLTLAGNLLYSGSSNSEMRAWRRDPSNSVHPDSTDKIVATSIGAFKSLVIVGDRLFSAHQDCKIRVWKINNNNDDMHQKYNCIATLPTLNDRFLRFFSGKNYVQVRRHKKCTWVHHVDTVTALAISRDGSLLFSASWDRTFKVWRTSDFRCLESVSNAHDDAINAMILSNDGFVYTGSADKKIKSWNKQAGKKKYSLVATMERHNSAVNALALSTDGSVLYSGACDRSILVWEKDANNSGGGHMVVAGALRGHTKAILCLAVVSDLVCSGSADKTVRIWRRGVEKNYYCLAVFEGHRGPVKCLTAAIDQSDNNGRGSVPDSAGTSYLVYSGSLDCDIRIWHIYLGSNSSIS
ncbi:hypothetical protein GH714_027278 [Hevea brasiliensis]|uniref:Anaphase-promoting complex subunit 4 WD40 domain-containing protein n=1 Tax=Hevea brasiliensis TaxID=3981 RepID=A0A6A6NJD2_HEVBR|nr:hypothetical protein GH714_027278 [Hevea brasiliensis]